MKMLVAGVKRIAGNSKKTGNDYDMPRLFGLVPIEKVRTATMEITGHGMEQSEMNLDPDCLDQFAKYEGKFPVLLDLETDVMPRFGKFESVVTGIKGVVAAVKAA